MVDLLVRCVGVGFVGLTGFAGVWFARLLAWLGYRWVSGIAFACVLWFVLCWRYDLWLSMTRALGGFCF